MNNETAPRLILASGSPRRQALLKEMGYTFEICCPDVDEHVSGRAEDIVKTLARRKAEAVAARFPDGVVIASDTLVSLDGASLGKPEDAADAQRMLTALSGREHDVFTGVCVMNAATGRTVLREVRTGVRFRTLTGDEISAYIATGEPMDKAGAYAIQGGAGSFENVMGFPVDEVREMLKLFDL